tara:strand:- start:88 stop:312 length:225 start_codon:yes stop_codon:yes gene_type:complete
MANLEFRGFLPQEEKPERFGKFRELASETYKNLNGKIVFSWISTLEQFDIIENTTEKNDIELRNMIGNDLTYLV